MMIPFSEWFSLAVSNHPVQKLGTSYFAKRSSWVTVPIQAEGNQGEHKSCLNRKIAIWGKTQNCSRRYKSHSWESWTNTECSGKIRSNAGVELFINFYFVFLNFTNQLFFLEKIKGHNFGILLEGIGEGLE